MPKDVFGQQLDVEEEDRVVLAKGCQKAPLIGAVPQTVRLDNEPFIDPMCVLIVPSLTRLEL